MANSPETINLALAPTSAVPDASGTGVGLTVPTRFEVVVSNASNTSILANGNTGAFCANSSMVINYNTTYANATVYSSYELGLINTNEPSLGSAIAAANANSTYATTYDAPAAANLSAAMSEINWLFNNLTVGTTFAEKLQTGANSYTDVTSHYSLVIPI